MKKSQILSWLYVTNLEVNYATKLHKYFERLYEDPIKIIE
jgi:hypothetical protein